MTHKDRFTIPFVFLKLCCDVAVIYAAFLCSFYIRFHAGLFDSPRGIPSLGDYQPFFLLGTLMIVLLFRGKGLYRGFWRGKFADEIFEVCKAVAAGIFVMMAFSFMYRGFTFSRGIVLIALPLEIVAITIERLVIERSELALRRARSLFTRVIVVGAGEPARKIARGIRDNKVLGYEFKGCIADAADAGSVPGELQPCLGGRDKLEAAIAGGAIDEVIMAEKRLTQEPYKAHVLGKTGYVAGASCLSGYILDPAGKPAIAFSVMVNKMVGLANAKRLEEDVCKTLVDSVNW